MKSTILKRMSVCVVLGLASTSVVLADHNSNWEEGWANMPNDIHNTRIDTRDEENDAFIDFVREGAGAQSVNRFLDDTDGQGGAAAASARGAGGRGTPRS